MRAADYNEREKPIMGPLTHLCHWLVKGDPWNKVANGPLCLSDQSIHPLKQLLSAFILSGVSMKMDHIGFWKDKIHHSLFRGGTWTTCSGSNSSSCNTINPSKKAVLSKITDIMWWLMLPVWARVISASQQHMLKSKEWKSDVFTVIWLWPY